MSIRRRWTPAHKKEEPMQRKENIQRAIPTTETEPEDRPQWLTDLRPAELAFVAAGSGSNHVKWYDKAFN